MHAASRLHRAGEGCRSEFQSLHPDEETGGQVQRARIRVVLQIEREGGDNELPRAADQSSGPHGQEQHQA